MLTEHLLRLGPGYQGEEGRVSAFLELSALGSQMPVEPSTWRRGKQEAGLGSSQEAGFRAEGFPASQKSGPAPSAHFSSLSGGQGSAVCFTYFSSPVQSANLFQMIAPPTSGVCPIKGLGKLGPWSLSNEQGSPIQSEELSE